MLSIVAVSCFDSGLWFLFLLIVRQVTFHFHVSFINLDSWKMKSSLNFPSSSEEKNFKLSYQRRSGVCWTGIKELALGFKLISICCKRKNYRNLNSAFQKITSYGKWPKDSSCQNEFLFFFTSWQSPGIKILLYLRLYSKSSSVFKQSVFWGQRCKYHFLPQQYVL